MPYKVILIIPSRPCWEFYSLYSISICNFSSNCISSIHLIYLDISNFRCFIFYHHSWCCMISYRPCLIISIDMCHVFSCFIVMFLHIYCTAYCISIYHSLMPYKVILIIPSRPCWEFYSLYSGISCDLGSNCIFPCKLCYFNITNNWTLIYFSIYCITKSRCFSTITNFSCSSTYSTCTKIS